MAAQIFTTKKNSGTVFKSHKKQNNKNIRSQNIGKDVCDVQSRTDKPTKLGVGNEGFFKRICILVLYIRVSQRFWHLIENLETRYCYNLTAS